MWERSRLQLQLWSQLQLHIGCCSCCQPHPRVVSCLREPPPPGLLERFAPSGGYRYSDLCAVPAVVHVAKLLKQLVIDYARANHLVKNRTCTYCPSLHPSSRPVPSHLPPHLSHIRLPPPCSFLLSWLQHTVPWFCLLHLVRQCLAPPLTSLCAP